MNAQNDNTPFWLEIKTEYIDANLDKVIDYLAHQSNMREKDAFYKQTLSLLSSRAKELIAGLSASPLMLEDEARCQPSDQSAYRIFGAYLLVQDSCSDALCHEAYFFFLKILASMLPDSYLEDMTELAVRSLLSDEISTLGFSWEDIRRLTPELTAIKLKNSVVLAEKQVEDMWYQGKGSIHLNDGLIELHCTNRDDAKIYKTASSMPVLDDMITVHSDPSSRIKQSEEDSIEAMSRFTQDFIKAQEKSTPCRRNVLKSYAPGDMLPARFLGRDAGGALMFESVDTNYNKISGTIKASAKVYEYAQYTADVVGRYLEPGSVIELQYKGTEKETFSMQEAFLLALCEQTISENAEVPAVLKKVNHRGTMTWWTADGYLAYVEGDADALRDYVEGDCAILLIDKASSNGYVYASIVEPTDERISEDDARRYCVEGMLVKYRDVVFEPPKLVPELSECVVKGLCRFLFRYQKALGLASERYRVLCVCRMLAAMSSDDESRQYLSLAAQYIENLAHFAGGWMDKLRRIDAGKEYAAVPGLKRRAGVVDILMSYGVDEDSDALSLIINDPEADPLLIKLAKLVQSCNRIDDVYPAIKTVIKREITKFLAVETEDNTDFEEESGPNFGVENSRTEFKTSFFYAPMGAKEQKQEKNIFRSLCSFLNTQEGGILYIGVNDAGYIAGIDADMEYLHNNIYGSYVGVDGYVRYIQDRMRDYFELDVRVNIHIDAVYDGRVLAMRVDPYMYGVVEFEKVAYIRNNNESVKMSQTLRRQIEARKVNSNFASSRNIIALREAIRERRTVVLKNYASSSSEMVADRVVEPFELICKDTMLWCYDTSSGSNKIFKLSRIGEVQITRDAWANAAKHEKSRMDIFHFTGDKIIPVKLELDLVSRNLLVEEYPESAADIARLGESRWLLRTNVCSLVGVARFYCGLASHIRIVDSPELKDFVKCYLGEALSAL